MFDNSEKLNILYLQVFYDKSVCVELSKMSLIVSI